MPIFWNPDSIRITAEPHPLLDARAFITRFSRSLENIVCLLEPLFGLDAPAPLTPSDEVREKVRDLLRHGGFKPSGRNKPASEYLIGALEDGRLGSINPAVDACNVVSLHSGLPISVVDLDKLDAPLSIRVVSDGSYVFNEGGQTIDLAGLIALCDAEGPCANPVKDSQRTKTAGKTRHTLSIVWGTRALPGRADEATAWYRELLHGYNAATKAVDIEVLEFG